MKIDQLIRSRRKSIALIVQPDGQLVVRAPLHTSEQQIRALVEQKSDWIRSKQKLLQQKFSAVRPHSYADGETFFYLGQKYPLVLAPQARRPLEFKNAFLLQPARRPMAPALLKAWYRRAARQVFEERTAFWAQRCGFRYKQVKITSAQTRWGSCSSKGTISFTWRLVMAPLAVIDYVVVHELVHTVVHNHSPAFWDAVRKIVPDYAQKVDWLKQNGYLLTIE